MQVIDRGTAFAAQPGTNRQSCTFPGICVLPSGGGYVAFELRLQRRPPLDSRFLTFVPSYCQSR